jgi:hypothetical protein
MSKDSKLSNVYLPKTQYFTYLGNNSFTNCTNLERIDLEEENSLCNFITNIGFYCFGIDSPYSLTKKHMKVAINGLPTSLKTLGDGALYGGLEGGNPNIIIENLPNGLSKLSTSSLRSCPNANIQIFGSEYPGMGLQTIEGGALHNSGTSIENIIINKSITNLATTTEIGAYGVGAFSGYGPNGNINKVIHYKDPKEIFNTESPSKSIEDFLATGLKYNEIEFI